MSADAEQVDPIDRVAELAEDVAETAGREDAPLGELDWYVQAMREEIAAAAERRLDR